MRGSLRNAILGLIDAIPLVGSAMTRVIEDNYPSPRETEQATTIARQAAEIETLKAKVAKLSRPESSWEQSQRLRKDAERIAQLDRLGRWHQ